MKKFKFNLESVLNYRERIEESEKNILTNLNNELSALMTELNALRMEYRNETNKFEDETSRGMTVQTALGKQAYIKSIERKIEIKLEQIKIHEHKVQRQTQVVVKASQDKQVLEKLKDKKFHDYKDKTNKEEERFVEEFVSYQSIIQ